MYEYLSKESKKILWLRDKLGKRRIPHVFDNEYKCDYNITYPYDNYKKYKVCLSYGEICLIEYNERYQVKEERHFESINKCYKLIKSDWRKNKRKYKRLKNVI